MTHNISSGHILQQARQVLTTPGVSLSEDYENGVIDTVAGIFQLVREEAIELLEYEDSTIEVLFDENNPNWRSVSEYNIMFLRQVQAYLNQKLRAQKHLFVFEVLDELGVCRTPESITRGWLYENGTRVDFGIWDENDTPTNLEIFSGDSITLTLKHDGVIYEKI